MKVMFQGRLEHRRLGGKTRRRRLPDFVTTRRSGCITVAPCTGEDAAPTQQLPSSYESRTRGTPGLCCRTESFGDIGESRFLGITHRHAPKA